MFSNDHRVLSRCDTRLRLLYLLNKAKTNTDVTNCLYNCLVNEYTDAVNEGNDFLYRATLQRGGDGSG